MCGGLIGFSVVDAILFRSIVYIPCHFPSYFTHFSIGLRSIIKWICRLLFFVFIIPNIKKKLLRITNYKFLYQNTQLCVFYSSIQTSDKYWLILILWLILKSCITKFSILPKIYKITSLNNPELVYYGHTCQTLSQRFTSHKKVSNSTYNYANKTLKNNILLQTWFV